MFGETVKCPICGKTFVPAPQHIYKFTDKGRIKSVCSWGCMRAHEKKIEQEKEEQKKKRKEKQK